MSLAGGETIRVVGAREHNLQGVSLELPKNRLICFTGVSGSGKSSLAFDTLFAEGQRRYIESLSAYVRQFLGQLPRPEVEQISGLSPSVSIQQKTSGWNPRSTVGTVTQIHDFLRVLFARVGTPHCTRCGRPIATQTPDQLVERVMSLPEGTQFLLLAPKVRNQKGEHREVFAELVQQGFVRARVDGTLVDLSSPPALDRYRRHTIEVVVDRLVVRPEVRPRLAEAIELALSIGAGTAIVSVSVGEGQRPRGASGERGAAGGDLLLSVAYACTACGLSFEPPEPQMFSFNSPQGMCRGCEGLGTRYDFDPELLVPDPSLSFLAPCIAALRRPPGRWRRHIYEGVARHVGFDLRAPWRDLPKAAREALLYGTGQEQITFEWHGRYGVWRHSGTFEGVLAELRAKYRKASSPIVRRFYEQFMRQSLCGDCRGARLNPQALAVKLSSRFGSGQARNIHEVCQLSVRDALSFFEQLELDRVGRRVAEEPLREICGRLRFLMDVGLDYLTLGRPAPTLSGGESQRIRLASQIGCGLVGVLYVLDEPSIGLHPRDNRRLLDSLRRLCDLGNTVIVVEHDRDTMLAADMLVDFGPGAGRRGGRIVAAGTIHDLVSCSDSRTGAYLSGRESIPVPATRRPINPPPKALLSQACRCKRSSRPGVAG
jgi:excinuclease ABC subunit A